MSRHPRKIFGTAGCIADRKLEYEVCSAKQSHPGAGKFIKNGRFASLDKISGHHDQGKVCTGTAFRLRDLPGMAVVERVVFGNNADGFSW